ncbi:MAG TPA: glycoside hydrolase family 19 protein [Ottowia sp.]|uniref:glycoside hydrolase family 19 protein n=1 Tax=Ottowia sp. TaxID=1898956 RepID=UPI002C9F23A2|nr:glycoside hydrolase family 19 protein [Ottowia sp.]HMN22519.1 glycoside hydrolase family 19 protein [Ottowia sp.]
MLSDLQLAQIMRHASSRRRAQCLEPLNRAMQAHQIDANLGRAAAFLAQLGHESGELQFLEELWGPTAAQRRYEPPGDLARRLGNTQAGDGRRFKGRGPIQITGRDNYARYGELLGLDLLEQPELAADPEVGFEIAALFWARNGLNALADANRFTDITQRINGGQNGAADRERLYALARQVLAGSFPAVPANAPAQSARRTRRAAVMLARGQEAIAQDRSNAAEDAAPDPAPGPRRASAGTRRSPAADALPRTLDVRPDTLDFRDLMYTPTLVEVPTHVPLGDYLDWQVPILDQGSEGACTGYGLATVAQYLLQRRRVVPDPTPVSPRMMYDLARRYDEWPGEDYSGSSTRGAMKGWHKHGVCAESLYPSRAPVRRSARRTGKAAATSEGGLNDARVADALQRPLGAYFRVNHKDLVAMHSAITEVGVLYASCSVHDGWSHVGADGLIVQSSRVLGGHAFAIVAYDERGFWIQNSWGPGWGRGGFALLSYDDWLENGTDVWVARLGAPVRLQRLESTAAVHARTAAQSTGYSFADLRPHIVSVGNNGVLKAGGDYGNTPQELRRVFVEDIPRVTAGWAVPRVLLYAHGGLVGAQAAVQRLAEYRPLLLGGEVYPLAFIWRTDYWTTITNILRDAVSRRKPEGMLDAAKDFMLDRLDDALEPLARGLTGKSVWDEIKENALAASARGCAATLVADQLQALRQRLPRLEVHLVGHSAGSILLAPLVGLLGRRGIPVKTCTLWAPACRVELFHQHYVPALQARGIEQMTIFALTDKAEQDDNCGLIYNKSLLYLVSNAFEDKARIPFFRDGAPILGMERFIDRALMRELAVDLVLAPNTEPADSLSASSASHHGDFDDDQRTVVATFRRIVAGSGASVPAAAARPARAGLAGDAVAPAAPMFNTSESALRDQRRLIDLRTKTL